jgi:hypothetical protein
VPRRTAGTLERRTPSCSPRRTQADTALTRPPSVGPPATPIPRPPPPTATATSPPPTRQRPRRHPSPALHWASQAREPDSPALCRGPGGPGASVGSLPAGRLRAGGGRPLDEPGWSLRSRDQAGTTRVAWGDAAVCAPPYGLGVRISDELRLGSGAACPPRRARGPYIPRTWAGCGARNDLGTVAEDPWAASRTWPGWDGPWCSQRERTGSWSCTPHAGR